METIHTERVPPEYQEGFELLCRTLFELAGENLLGVTAFGFWLVGDALPDDAATSVMVLERVDLELIDRLAEHGQTLGAKRLRAPLVMTPAYIDESCDVFPLELLEIQQTRRVVCGEDFFAGCGFEPADVRLQAERELKSELIQLRQGLLAAAGRRRLLDDLARAAAARMLRILRGLLYLAGVERVSERAAGLVVQAARTLEIKLPMLHDVVCGLDDLGFEGFGRFYGEVEALATHANTLEPAG